MVFTWKELLILNGTTVIARYPATCRVRNELNGKRLKSQVVRTFPNKGKSEPYYPRTFPSGIHRITAIEWLTNEKEIEKFGPVKIRTDAWRKVFTWDLDKKDNYHKPTGSTQIDTEYHIHHTHRYLTTHGCIRGGKTEAQMISIAKILEQTFENGETIYIEIL